MRRRIRRLTRALFGRSTGLMQFLRLGSTRHNYAQEVGDLLYSSLPGAVLGWIARTFPEAPPAIWPKDVAPGQEKPLVGHPLIKLLERPNPFYTGPLLWMATLTDWNANGNAYWLKERARSGEVVRLWWAPSWTMKPVSDKADVFITHYVYTVDGEEMELDNSEVVHFRYGMDPQNPRLGMSPLSAVLREIFTDNEAANFTASLLRNMGVPGLLVSPDTDGVDITPEEADDVKATIKARFTGDRRGDPVVLTAKTKLQEFGFSPEQLVLKDLRRVPEERVTAATGIPAIVVGFGAGLERSTFTNMGEAREAAYEAGLIPMQRILAEDIRFQLLIDFESEQRVFELRFGFDLSQVRVLQEDLYRLAQRMDVAVRGGWGQVYEARVAAGLEATDADRIYLRQTSYVEVPANGGEVRALAPASSNGTGNGAGNGALVAEVTESVIRAIDARETLRPPTASADSRGGN